MVQIGDQSSVDKQYLHRVKEIFVNFSVSVSISPMQRECFDVPVLRNAVKTIKVKLQMTKNTLDAKLYFTWSLTLLLSWNSELEIHNETSSQ